ncbi:MAG: CoA transferase [Acidimicrobiia bacterium]
MTSAQVLHGLKVLDLSGGIAGPVATMLLADYGAEVIVVEPSAGPRRPHEPIDGSVWRRGKTFVTGVDRTAIDRLVAEADVLVECGDVDYATTSALNPRLVHCSITGYGRRGDIAMRPAYDLLVQARSGIQNEQPGLREGPIFLHTALPSFGAALIANVAIHAALHARHVTGEGQHVDTSLMQGALLWMTQIWRRPEHPTPDLMDLWKFKHLGPTPCFEAGDGEWFHPMPNCVPVGLQYLGRDPMSIMPGGLASGDLASRTAYFEAATALWKERPRDEWVKVLQAADTPCQPVMTALDALVHPQIVNNRTVFEVDDIKQFGRAFHLELDIEPVPAAARTVASDDAVFTSPAQATAVVERRAARSPLDGIRVLDFGTALAGPFGPMIMSDLGADVIKVDPIDKAGTASDATYAACHRGKRSIAINLKTAQGRQIATELIAQADVLHYNLRTGVAERLGFGYDQAKAINPSIIFCHLTAYGNTGPYALWPGVDQMGQALCGLEYEQGGTPSGGHPSWYRFGMCDATAGMLSVIGVLQALGHRDRTGEGQSVEANILSGAMLLASDAYIDADGTPHEPRHVDRDQTGFSDRYRLWQTSDGWVAVAAPSDEEFRRLHELVGTDLAGGFLTRTADAWYLELDAAGIAVEIASIERGQTWYDEPDVVANGWSVSYDHPVHGKFDQPGRFFEFSATPSRIYGPPPMIGQHTRDILRELGRTDGDIESLRAAGVVGW